MEKLHAQNGYDAEFVTALTELEEVVVPYFTAESFVESMDKTRKYIRELIKKHDLGKIGDKYTVSGGRYTSEYGHHYWVRLWDPYDT